MAQAYPEDVEKVISIMETSVALGCAVGPVIGSVVYAQLGYAWTFIAFGSLLVPMSLLMCFLTKPKDVKSQREAEKVDSELEKEQE